MLEHLRARGSRKAEAKRQTAGAAEQEQRVAVAKLEAEAVTGEVQSKRDKEIATAEREAETIAAKKKAEQEQRTTDCATIAVVGGASPGCAIRGHRAA